MWDLIKTIFKFKSSIPVVMLIIGAILYMVCLLFPFYDNYPKIFALCSKLGDLFLISSLLSFLTSTAESLGVFRNALEEVIYDPKYLKNRKDLKQIWEKVSKVLFKSRFPQISHNLLDKINEDYLSEKEVSYYSDYKNIYDIKFDKNDPGYIIVVNDITFTLNAVDDSEFLFPITNWICTNKEEIEKVSLDIKYIFVNDVKFDPHFVSRIFDEKKSQVCIKHDVKLMGSTKYAIRQQIEKKYSIYCDNYIAFQAKWLVNNITVQLFYPEEMKVLFVNRAASETFNLVKNKEGYLEYEYKGLILRRQGYIMILNPKKKSYEN